MTPREQAKDYQYEVAISFLRDDEALALKLRTELSPLRVFVYSKEQEKVAGTEGVETFRQVFRNQSLVSIVLFRSRWGQTPWTKVEEAAIRDHCLESGWNHLMFVRLDREGDVPPWVPDSYIWLDFEAFGIPDLIGATKFKCASLGVSLQQPSILDRAASLAARAKFQDETLAAMNRGPEPFKEAMLALFEPLDAMFAAFAEGSGWELVRGYDERTFVASARGVSLQISPMNLYANSCNGSTLVAATFSGRIVTPQERASGRSATFQPTPIGRTSYKLARSEVHGWCWKLGDSIQANEVTARQLVEQFISTIERQIERQNR